MPAGGGAAGDVFVPERRVMHRPRITEVADDADYEHYDHHREGGQERAKKPGRRATLRVEASSLIE